MSNFPSRRSVVMGFNGAVATSQPLAAQAGLRILMQGGNAADAAVATAAALNVVEPMSTGMGGDVFALFYIAAERRVYALNASGRAPYAATLEEYARRGLTEIPRHGILPVTVPGAAAGWADTISRFGRLRLDTVLKPAIEYAEQGYPVSERISYLWTRCESLLANDAEATRVFLPGGRAPRAGARVSLPDLAGSLRLLANDGPDAFYRGPIARAIVEASRAYDGLLTMQDLADHTSTWVEPIHIDYRGYRVFECPPNGHGIAALIALNILSAYDLAGMGFDSTDALHLKMEAMKLAMTDASRYVADPELAHVPIEALLSADYAARRRESIRMDRAIAEPQPGMLPITPDTVYLSVVDGEGNAVSFINSLYTSFGSGIVARGTGIALQNRGNLFVLDPDHPNCIAPHKRPYHTIIPCMVTREDRLALCFGVMGGYMQPQGHVQVLTNIIDHGMNPQQALDAPRFMYQQGREYIIENSYDAAAYPDLEARGHILKESESLFFGGGQVIMVDPESGALMAGSEPRNDGCAVAY
ncbi:MAG: gamma-glutamyltransferase [Anaerolineae bacterium]|jgi:gamma-glutamyltranspeptidase/glutathione hydrolase